MRIVLQRVSHALLNVDDKLVCSIGRGLLVYLGVAKGDCETDAQFIADKITNLRIFPDAEGKMNLSVKDVTGDILLVSNFTLSGNCQKGRRPSFDPAAEPDVANALYEKTANLIAAGDISIKKGIFGAHMHITSTNDGPVNFIIDSRQKD